jgi:hypothetical protein
MTKQLGSFIENNRRVVNVVLCVGLLLSLFWVIFRGLTFTNERIDGKVLYIAGKAVEAGISPYEYGSQTELWMQAFGHKSLDGQIFAYPPLFIPFVRLLSVFSVNWAMRILDAINVLSLMMSFLALYKIMKAIKPTASLTTHLLGLLFASFVGAISSTITTGQTSLLVDACILWTVYFLINGSGNLALSLVLIIAAIKPQLSLIPCFGLLVLYGNKKKWLFSVIFMSVYTVLIAVWLGPDIYSKFLTSLTEYQVYGNNKSVAMSGIGQLLSIFGKSISLPASLMLGFLTIVVVLLIRFITHRTLGIKQDLANNKLFVVVVIFLIMESVVSLHSYDHTILMLPICLSVLFTPIMSIAMLPLLLLAARPAIIESLTKGIIGPETGVSLLLTLSLIIVLLAYLRTKNTTRS